MHGSTADRHLDSHTRQIYEIVTELLNFYNNFRTVISQDECYRLLGGVVPKALLPCAVSTPPYGTPL